MVSRSAKKTPATQPSPTQPTAEELLKSSEGKHAFHVSVESDATLLRFDKNGVRCEFDFIDGKLCVLGNLPVSEAAAMFFLHVGQHLVNFMDARNAHFIEEASKPR